MKTLRIILLFLIIGISSIVKSQNISGTITDHNNIALPYTNVALYSVNGNKLITGTITDSTGHFSIKSPNRNKSELIIITSFVGMLDDTMRLSTIENLDNIQIRLQPDPMLLDEIIIEAYKHPVKIQGSVITADVEHSLLSKMGTIDHMMNKIPFVNSKDCELTIFGRGSAEVYINNQKVYDKTLIKQLSPDNIKKVEVITNPDPKYGSDVNSVIKIYTKNHNDGFSADIDLTLRANTKLSENLFVSLIYAKNGWQFATNCNFANHYKEKKYYDRTENHASNSILNDYTDYYYDVSLKSVWTGVNYAISKTTNIGGSFWLFESDETNSYSQQLVRFTNGVNDYNESASAPTNFVPKRQFGNFYYNTKLASTSLDFSYDYVSVRSTRHNLYIQQNTKVIDDLHTDNDMHSWLLSLSTPVNDKFKFSYGTEITYTTDLQFNELSTENINTSLSNTNTERRQILNGDFASISFNGKNISAVIGLRYEYAELEYYQQKILDNNLSRKYNHILPNMNFGYTINNDISVSIGYRETIKRPAYNRLSDNLRMYNQFNYTAGNATLQPFHKKTFNSMITIYDFNIIASINNNKKYITDDYILSSDDNNIIITRKCNIDNFIKNTLGVEWSHEFGFYSPDIEIDFSRQHLKGTYLGKSINYNTPVWDFSISNSFSLPWKTTATLDLEYSSRGHNIFDYNHETWSSCIDINKVFNFGLSLDLSFNNYFIPRNEIIDTKRNSLFLYSNGDAFVREVLLTINYTLNKTKVKSSRRNNSAEYNRLGN